MRRNQFILFITLSIYMLINSAFSQDTTLTVTSDGYVGIGTSSPSQKLVIGDDFGQTQEGNRITVGNNSGPSGLNLGTNINNHAFLFWDYENKHLRIGTRNVGTWFGANLVLKDGKIGSGTYDPVEKLDIRGNIAVNGTVDGVDVSDLKSEFENHQSGYTQFDNLQFPTSVGGTWVKTSPTQYHFTKSQDNSKIEIFFNGEVELSNMNGVDACQIRIRVDDTNLPEYDNYGIILPEMVAGGSPDWQSLSIMAVFEGISAGDHTISLWARNRPSNASSIVVVDPGNYGAKIIVKETW